jgi:tRNA threonylcarbamoyladenosine biosynthesis protein TsaE
MHLSHPSILESRHLRWADEAACAAFATRLARAPDVHNAFLTLQGPLGAGKTTFVRHLLRALGVTGRIKSPTYTVMEPYQAGSLDIAHFDFYRFNDPREWEDAGFRDVFARPGLKLAEWPEKAAGALPTPDLALHLAVPASAEDASDAPPPRQVRLDALTPTGLRLLHDLGPDA